MPVRLFLGEICSPMRGDCLGEDCIEFGNLFLFTIFKGLSIFLVGELFYMPEVSQVGKLVPGIFVPTRAKDCFNFMF